MNRLILLLGIIGVVLFLAIPTAVIAQEVTADDYVELFKPLVGTWNNVITVDEKAVEGRFWCRLSRTNKCLVCYGEGGILPASASLQGYDPAAKEWKVAAFDADGGFALTAITVKDMKKGKTLGTDYSATSKTVRYAQDGKKITSSDTVKVTAFSPDRIEALVTDRREDGQPQPDIKFATQRQPDQRRPPAAVPATPAADSQDVTADDYVAFWKPLVGSWKTVYETAESRSEEASRVRLSPTNRCLVTYAEPEGSPAVQSIEGYDPGTKQWRRVGFDSDGGCREIVIEFADMTKGKRLEQGTIGKIERKHCTPDGKVSTLTATLACTEFAESRMAFTGSEGKMDGNPISDMTLTMERQPERERRAKQ